MRKNKQILVFALLFSFLCFPVKQAFAAAGMTEVPLTVKQSFVVENPVMRKNKQILVFALLFSFLCFPVKQAFAAAGMTEVPLTVKQSFVVENPVKEMDFTGNYEFRALDQEAPMPENTKNGIYSFSLNGEQVETTFSLQYLKEMDFTGNYEFRALDQEAPMPENTKNGIYSFSLNGEQVETTFSLQYLHAGVYHYQLDQTTAEKKGYQYDKSCYDITVYVKNGENGELIPQVVAEKGDGKKCGDLEFLNSYQGKKPGASAPSDPSKPNKLVKTGDTTHIMAYVGIAAGSLFLILALVYFRKHKQKK